MIKKPSPNWESLDYDETYSEFSITMVWFIYGLMITIIMDTFITLYSLYLGDDYYKTFYN